MKFISVVRAGSIEYINLSQIQSIRFHNDHEKSCYIFLSSGAGIAIEGIKGIDLEESFDLFMKSSEILWNERLDVYY